jgi:hypothetical protein
VARRNRSQRTRGERRVLISLPSSLSGNATPPFPHAGPLSAALALLLARQPQPHDARFPPIAGRLGPKPLISCLRPSAQRVKTEALLFSAQLSATGAENRVAGPQFAPHGQRLFGSPLAWCLRLGVLLRNVYRSTAWRAGSFAVALVECMKPSSRIFRNGRVGLHGSLAEWQCTLQRVQAG